MGYPDELLESLMTHLKSKGTGLVPFASATVDMRIEYTSRVPWLYRERLLLGVWGWQGRRRRWWW